MKKIKPLLIMLSILAIIFSSCTHRVLDFTLISSKNVDLTKGASFVRGKNRVEGKDQVHIIIFIPTGTVNIKEALDRAIETTPGCIAILDGVIYSKFWWIPYIYGQESATVEGTPLIDPALASNANPIPLYSKIELKRDGRIKSVDKISSEEYFAMKDKIVKNSQMTKFENTAMVK